MIHRLRSVVYFLAVLIILSAGDEVFARDDTLRCGNDLINLGETMFEVRKSCGEPYSIRDVGEKRQFRVFNKKKRSVEFVLYLTEWIYERNDGIYVLTFEGSRLVRKEFIFD